ncbi:MAG: alpha/beta hydrolase [Candidatus Marsarchaeota archaeon]|nr:alpha/beta hydrolase [Candidatus Marsarchaeota archaeon]MCL5106113.1 alpha/beta hydrolase [Candidatus Marsarchaeota archaeon]
MINIKINEGFVKTPYGKIYFKLKPAQNAVQDARYKLLLIHGLGGTSNTFKKLINELPDDMEVCALDLLGHGKSDKPNIKYSIGLQAEILHYFLTALKYSNFYIYGHSYGAHVAMRYALYYGTKKANGFIIEDSPILKTYFRNLSKNKKLINKIVKTALTSKSSKKQIVLNSLDDIIEDGLADIFFIDKPILIIWGEKDEITKIEFAYKLRTKSKNVLFRVIKNAHHIPHYSNPMELSDLLLKFIGYNHN